MDAHMRVQRSACWNLLQRFLALNFEEVFTACSNCLGLFWSTLAPVSGSSSLPGQIKVFSISSPSSSREAGSWRVSWPSISEVFIVIFVFTALVLTICVLLTFCQRRHSVKSSEHRSRLVRHACNWETRWRCWSKAIWLAGAGAL